MTQRHSVLAPLRVPEFSLLWGSLTAVLAGQWMQALGAQWFLLESGASYLVPAVMAAVTLPMALLSIPAGVLGDTFDRRRLILLSQVAALIVSITLALTSWLGVLSPAIALAGTGLIACAMAITMTPFQSLLPDLVGRSRITSAAALLSVGVNTARITGPAVAGFAISLGGVTSTFALDALLILIMIIAVTWWRGAPSTHHHKEAFLPAIRSGVRYVRHSPQIIRILIRGLWFTLAMMALLSLLPVLAVALGANSSQLGLLLAAQGAGAVVGGFTLPWLRHRLSANVLVTIGFIVSSATLAAMTLVHTLGVAGILLAIAGWTWTILLGSLNAEVQVYLPAWVRARGIGLYGIAVYGGQGIGSLAMGFAAERYGLTRALMIGALSLLVGATSAIWAPLRELSDIDRSPAVTWVEPSTSPNREDAHVALVVTMTYEVADGSEAEFLNQIRSLRRIRLRNGATSWELLRDTTSATSFSERFSVPNWDQYNSVIRDRTVMTDVSTLHQLVKLCTSPPAKHVELRILPR